MQTYDVIKTNAKPLLFLNKEEMLIYSKGALYLLNINDNSKKKVCAVPMHLAKRLLSKIRIFERIFRLETRAAIKLNNNDVLISFHGAVYRVSLEKENIILEHRYIDSMNNPLGFSRISKIRGFTECIAYGEYTINENKNDVSIYTRGINANDKWKKVYTFPENTITHIHAIVPDPYRDGVLILTGDDDKNSGIWLAQNDFESVKPLIVGSQQYRSCCAYPLEQGILYATDTPLEDNYLYFASEQEEKWIVHKIASLTGSCIYSTKWNDKYLFSTTVEYDPTVGPRRLLFTYKLGYGIKSRSSKIIVGNLNEGFKCAGTFQKDVLPMGLCQYGTVQFCKGQEEISDCLFIHPVAVKKYDNTIIRFRRFKWVK